MPNITAQIDQHIRKNLDGYLVNEVTGPNNHPLRFYNVNGRSVIVQNFGDDGAEVYIAVPGNKLKRVLTELAKL